MAERALHRCVNLNPDNGIAWNNLGSVFLHTNQFMKAYKVFQESIKADYENWNVWDNYQNACHQVKDFEEEIVAFHRLLELKGSLSAEALSILVAAVTANETDVKGHPSQRLKPKLRQLLGALTARLSDNSRIWYIYGKLVYSDLSEEADAQRRVEIIESIVQKWQKAYRYAVAAKDWDAEEATLAHTMNVAKDLSSLARDFANGAADAETKRNLLFSCQVMINGVLKKIDNRYQELGSANLKLPPFLIDQYQQIKGINLEIDNLLSSSVD